MSRLMNPVQPIEVETNEREDAIWYTWQGRRERVVEVANRWRVDDNWWRKPISRLYFEWVTPTMLIEVYMDLLTGEWFLERLHD